MTSGLRSDSRRTKSNGGSVDPDFWLKRTFGNPGEANQIHVLNFHATLPNRPPGIGERVYRGRLVSLVRAGMIRDGIATNGELVQVTINAFRDRVSKFAFRNWGRILLPVFDRDL